MDPRTNLLSLYRRTGYEDAPVYFNLCPDLEAQFTAAHPGRSYADHYRFPFRILTDPGFPWIAEIPGFVPARTWDRTLYFDEPVQPGARFDIWGIAHEPGGRHCHHMTRMRHPLERLDSLEQLQDYPWPDFAKANWSFAKREADAAHAAGLALFVWMECTIWEVSWYLRSMDRLMTDMALAEEKAVFLLDRVTDLACLRAAAYARAGADILSLGDDVGMQNTIMMSRGMYTEWLKPRLARVIQAARAVKPDLVVQYHSCGFVRPLIPDLIEAGVSVLNPVQPECMDFAELHREFGERLSFNGTIGTQTTMPFGSPADVRRAVLRNLGIAGPRGGLLCCPTHMLEPEVPWANIEAYVGACREFTRAGGSR